MGRPGEGDHDARRCRVLVTFAELIHGRALFGVVHEVHVALEDLRIELQRVLMSWRYSPFFLVA
jgi:hypothetical protein